MARALKTMLRSQLEQELAGTNGCLVLETGPMTVEGVSAFRKELREKAGGARLRVVQNRTARLALESAWLKGDPSQPLRSMLRGQTAIAFGGSGPVPIAKVVAEYRKKYKPMLVKGAVADGEVLGPKDAEGLAKLPGLHELRGQMAGLISAPARGLVATMHGVLSGMVRVMQARVDAGSQDAAPKEGAEGAA